MPRILIAECKQEVSSVNPEPSLYEDFVGTRGEAILGATARMLEQSDAIVVYHTYPHVDFFSTGERAARLLLGIMAGGADPVMATVRVPALVRGDELITATGRIRHVIQAAKEIEASPGGL